MRDSSKNRFHIIMRDLNCFMNEGGFDTDLRVKLREYFKYRRRAPTTRLPRLYAFATVLRGTAPCH